MELRRGCRAGEIFGDGVVKRGRIMQISVTDFRPAQVCPAHAHKDLHEFFVCERGKIDITVNDETVVVGETDVVLVRPGSSHGLVNRYGETCRVLVIGISAPD